MMTTTDDATPASGRAELLRAVINDLRSFGDKASKERLYRAYLRDWADDLDEVAADVDTERAAAHRLAEAVRSVLDSVMTAKHEPMNLVPGDRIDELEEALADFAALATGQGE